MGGCDFELMNELEYFCTTIFEAGVAGDDLGYVGGNVAD